MKCLKSLTKHLYFSDYFHKSLIRTSTQYGSLQKHLHTIVRWLNHKSYVGALGPMGLYGPIATLWNGGVDKLKLLADQLKLHGCVHFTKETCVCGFKFSKKRSFGPIQNDTRPIVATGCPRMPQIISVDPPPLLGVKRKWICKTTPTNLMVISVRKHED